MYTLYSNQLLDQKNSEGPQSAPLVGRDKFGEVERVVKVLVE